MQPVIDKPTRWKRPTLLIVGCGDVGLRVVALLQKRWRLLALTSSPDRMALLRSVGALPLLGDLDDAPSLVRLAGLADAVLHLAPPPNRGTSDSRSAGLLRVLLRQRRLRRIVYASTTGVYGDCAGARIDETRPVAPGSDRARRRLDAERRMRSFALATGARLTILRVPGIYAGDRAGGARERLLRGTPVIDDAADVYTNHIHADDLARACVAALHRGLPQRVVHASDDTELKMGAYFDLAADLFGLPRPPRIARADAGQHLSTMQLSFIAESRRLGNERLKRELRVRLRYPTVADGLRDGLATVAG
jgi:nucleoside-diphosphate-sugar epimerase